MGIWSFTSLSNPPTRFKNCDTVISFLGTEGTNGVFQGCYQVGGFVPYNRAKLPEDFTPDRSMSPSTSVIYELTRTDLLADLKDRLVIDWEMCIRDRLRPAFSAFPILNQLRRRGHTGLPYFKAAGSGLRSCAALHFNNSAELDITSTDPAL